MKINHEELITYYKAVRHGVPGDGEYEDAIEAILNAVPDLIIEHRTLQECVRELGAENTELRQHLKDYCIKIEDEEDTLTEEIINSIPEDWAEASIKNNIRNGGGRNYL